jgi:DNA-binding GntR family transcriptional regulator
MVTHVTNRGYRVVLPASTAFCEMQAIRLVLEVEAAAQALPHIGPAEFKHINA